MLDVRERLAGAAAGRLGEVIRTALGEPGDVPGGHPLIGNVSATTEVALSAAGHDWVPPAGTRDFAAAAARVLETAREVPYGSLEIEYMQTFSTSGRRWSS